jgi:hypothetical protein
MALSNWDCAYFSLDGCSVTDTPIIANISMAMRKVDVIASCNGESINLVDGNMIWRGVHIHAKIVDVDNINWPFTGQFFFAYTPMFGADKFVGGIGCYGFLDGVTYLRRHKPELFNTIPKNLVSPEANDFLRYDLIQGGGDQDDMDQIVFYDTDPNHLWETVFEIVYPEPSFDELWVGIEPWLVESYIKWVKEMCDANNLKTDWPDKIIANFRRFNQGDKYIAEHMGTEIPHTTSEQASGPIIKDII